MQRTAKLSASLTICWETERGYDRDAEVEVDYTFDGEDIEISKWEANTDELSDDEIDDLIMEQLEDIAPEAYAEWLAELGDWQHEQARDRKLWAGTGYARNYALAGEA